MHLTFLFQFVNLGIFPVREGKFFEGPPGWQQGWQVKTSPGRPKIRSADKMGWTGPGPLAWKPQDGCPAQKAEHREGRPIDCQGNRKTPSGCSLCASFAGLMAESISPANIFSGDRKDESF